MDRSPGNDRHFVLIPVRHVVQFVPTGLPLRCTAMNDVPVMDERLNNGPRPRLPRLHTYRGIGLRCPTVSGPVMAQPVKVNVANRIGFNASVDTLELVLAEHED